MKMKTQVVILIVLLCLAVGLSVYQHLPRETITIIEIPATQLKGVMIP